MVALNNDGWQDRYLAMLPMIEKQIAFELRNVNVNDYDEMFAELRAHTCCAFARLVERGEEARANPSALANFAYRQYRDGRRVGNSRCKRDVFYPLLYGVSNGIKRINFGLDRNRAETREDCEILDALTCNRAPILDQVAFRIDCSDWLRSLSPRKRAIARLMARGESTSDLAIMLKVCRARVSQYRRELETSWREFVGECE